VETTLLYTGGFYSLGFAVFHLLFWKLFRWKADLRSLMPINRGIMQILNLRLISVFLLFALLSLLFPRELLSTELGTVLLAAMSVFWFGRAVEQVVFFGLQTGASIAFFVIFIAGGTIYLLPCVV
jgi:hypothetical protein